MLSLQEIICAECLRLAAAGGYQLLRPEGGAPSSTFTPGVFALPHLHTPLRICGFNTAVRPTDIDGGFHLPVFGQFYLAANDCCGRPDLKARALQLVTQLISNISPALGLGISNLELEPSGYGWEADSSGYSGQAYEINIVSAAVNSKRIRLGSIEIAQANQFCRSGLKPGRDCELLVIGIDRLISMLNLLLLLDRAGEMPEATMPQLIALLYPAESYAISCRQDYSAESIESTILRLRSPARNPASVYNQLLLELAALQQAPDQAAQPPAYAGRIDKLANWSRRLELAYATRAVAAETRTAFIHALRPLFAELAEYVSLNSAGVLSEISGRFEQPGDLLPALPGLHHFAAYCPIDCGQTAAFSAAAVKPGRKPPSEKIAELMLVSLVDSDLAQQHSPAGGPILVDATGSSGRSSSFSAISNLLGLTQTERQRVLKAAEAIIQAEQGLTVRCQPRELRSMAALFDCAEPKLNPVCYDIRGLKEIGCLACPQEAAVVLLTSLDLASRGLSHYGKALSASESDYLGVRQARNAAVRTAIALDLPAGSMAELLEVLRSSRPDDKLLRTVQDYFLSRLKDELASRRQARENLNTAVGE